MAIDPTRIGQQFADEAAHKFGMGSPVGLGSLKATITDLKLIDRDARYRSLDSEPESVDTDDFVASARSYLETEQSPYSRDPALQRTGPDVEPSHDARPSGPLPGHS